MARHISCFNLPALNALNAQGATSPKLKAAPWNYAYRINGMVYAPSQSRWDEDASNLTEEEMESFESGSSEELEEYVPVEHLTPQGWSETPMWSRF